MPPDRSVIAVSQLFDVRVEATGPVAGDPPSGLRVFLDGREVTDRNVLEPGVAGEPGRGGTGATAPGLPPRLRAGKAPEHTTNFLWRQVAFDAVGEHVLEARTADGASASVRWASAEWRKEESKVPQARNVILFLGDGMGLAHRTAARLVGRGLADGKAKGRLAMDTLPVTGLVMTSSLDAAITDSSTGMAALVSGAKGDNGEAGVFPDNTADVFDNPRIDYLAEILRRQRGPGFRLGLVTTADVTDATPAANAVHSADRYASSGIVEAFLAERERTGLAVLMGGGQRRFRSTDASGDMAKEFERVGFHLLRGASELRRLLLADTVPAQILGLFDEGHMAVAFDKVGAGRYSEELARSKHEGRRDLPMLDEMTRLALRSLDAHSSRGFYLMVEGASIDKQSHSTDAERMIWDVLELDHAVAAGLEFARRTNTDADPNNDTLVVVTSDHETGGLALIGVGNEAYAPESYGRSVRDYAAGYRFTPEYELGVDGFPLHPDPPRKLLLGWASAPDHYENWLSNRRASAAAVRSEAGKAVTVANPERDGPGEGSDNRSVSGQARPGFLVTGSIENGAEACGDDCPHSGSSTPQTSCGHTAVDVPLSAEGPGAGQFTGVYENTDVLLKILRATAGASDGSVAPSW